MTVKAIYLTICDKCGEFHTKPFWRNFLPKGWVYLKGKHYCPDCAEDTAS